MSHATPDEIRPTALDPPSTCPIGWQPSALAPVFWGWREYGPTQGAPTRVRVFHPSIDSTPDTAAMLTGCGKYPLVVFAHGHCDQDANHYQRWFRTPAALARSGYVVAVPELPDIAVHPALSPRTQQALADTVAWMRQGWSGKSALLPAAQTGLAGHSYGALHAGILATRIPVAAVASLSGVWNDWQPNYGTKPIHQGTVPRLLTWGTIDPDATLSGPDWNAIAKPRHRAVFGEAEHYDYFPYHQNLPCRFGNSGPCPHVGSATDDLLVMFFANYLPPELWPDLPGRIPDNLVPPPLNLTPEQRFYAGAHLVGLSTFNATSSCSVSLSVELPLDKTVPHVREMLRPQADQAVRNAGLVPKFTGSTSASAWVASQSPTGGTKVAAGTTVTMTMQTGPIP